METEPAEVRGFAQSGARAGEFPVFAISALTRNLGARVALRSRGIRRLACSGNWRLVVVAARKRWRPMAKTRLARSLARAGHSCAVLGV
jgi:hypothetical protein